jgi:type I restriction enzyme S subunit
MVWDVKKLSEICDAIFAGGDVPKDRLSKFKTDKYNVPIYANGEKNKGLYGYTDIARVNIPSMTVSARGTIGYSEIRYEPFLPVVRLIVLTPNPEKVTLEYLKYVLRGMEFVNSGSSIPQLTVPMIKKYECSLPSLSEQKRIVVLLDTVFADLEQTRAKTEKNLKNARELFDSYLQQVFSNKHAGWITTKLKSITSKIGSGATPRGGKAAYKTEGMSLIRSMNVHDRQFKKKNLALIDDKQAEKLNNVEIQPNDVLLNITGASVARCCVVPEEYLPARVNQHVSIIRVNKNTIKPELLCYLLTSKYYKDILLGIGEAGSTRQAITKVQVENFEVSYPESMENQGEFIKQLTMLENDVLKLHAIYTKKIEAIDELKNSILQKAFRGELTTTAK